MSRLGQASHVVKRQNDLEPLRNPRQLKPSLLPRTLQDTLDG
jgi:hypothetical protein